MTNSLLSEMQPAILEKFKKILANGKLSHAYLFSGNFGAFEMAIYLTQFLFCEKETKPCGQCRFCRLIAENSFTDMAIVEPEGMTIKTDTIRSVVSRFSQSGFEGNRQVVIIKQAERMHPSAANSLLKALEEPQSDMTVFLLTGNPEQVLPTIKSRCQEIRFTKNKDYLTAKLEKEGLLPTQASVLAEISENLDEAIDLSRNTNILRAQERVFDFIAAWQSDMMIAYLQVPELATIVKERKEQAYFFEMLMVCLGKEFSDRAPIYLDAIFRGYQMWQANVSFQNALEYILFDVT